MLEASYRYRPERGVVDLEIEQVQPLVEAQGLFRLPVDVTVALPSGQARQRVWIEKAKEKILLPAAEEPLWVSLDGEGYLVAEIRVEQDIEALGLAARQDAPVGRLRALEELVKKYPGHSETSEALGAALAPEVFWALRAPLVTRGSDSCKETVVSVSSTPDNGGPCAPLRSKISVRSACRLSVGCQKEFRADSRVSS